MEKLNVFSCFLVLLFFLSFYQGDANKDWCIADPLASDMALSAFLDKACNHGNACKGIKPGRPCFLPPTLRSHASYMLNQVYRKTGKCIKDIGCYLNMIPLIENASITEVSQRESSFNWRMGSALIIVLIKLIVIMEHPSIKMVAS